MEQQNFQDLTPKALLKSSLIAMIIAAVILLLIILPAEYNIDPTGIGRTIGLTQLASSENPADIQDDKPGHLINEAQQNKSSQDSTSIEIFAGEGLEYKFYLKENQKLKYNWSTDKGPLHFDFHGEPEGDTTGFFESYTLASAAKMAGTLTTPFAGSHGWYWRNDTNQTIVINLVTSGQYEIIGLK